MQRCLGIGTSSLECWVECWVELRAGKEQRLFALIASSWEIQRYSPMFTPAPLATFSCALYGLPPLHDTLLFFSFSLLFPLEHLSLDIQTLTQASKRVTNVTIRIFGAKVIY